MRSKLGDHFWWMSLFVVCLAQSVIMFTGCLSLYPIYRGERDSTIAMVAGPVLTLAAVALETVADLQMDKFLSETKSSDAVMSTGVWQWCRHPNYFGEFGFWSCAQTSKIITQTFPVPRHTTRTRRNSMRWTPTPKHVTYVFAGVACG